MLLSQNHLARFHHYMIGISHGNKTFWNRIKKTILVILHLKTKSNERGQYGDQLQASGLILKLVPPTTTVPSFSQNVFLHKYFISNTTMNAFIH